MGSTICEGQHVAAGRAVLERARPAGALRQVAADGAFRLAGRIRRIEEPAGLDGALQVARDHVRLDDRQQVGLVDGQDAVEAGHGQHDAAADGHRAAGVAGAGAAHDERRAGVVAQPRDGRHLVDRAGRDHDLGPMPVAERVLGVRDERRGRRRHPGLAGDGGQGGAQVGPHGQRAGADEPRSRACTNSRMRVMPSRSRSSEVA